MPSLRLSPLLLLAILPACAVAHVDTDDGAVDMTDGIIDGSGGETSSGGNSAGGSSSGGASSGGSNPSTGGMSSGGAASGGTSTGGASTGGASTGGAAAGGGSSGDTSTGGAMGTGGSTGGASGTGGAGSCTPVSCPSNGTGEGCYALTGANTGWNASNCQGCTILLDGEDVSTLCAAGSINNQPGPGTATLEFSDCTQAFVGFACF